MNTVTEVKTDSTATNLPETKIPTQPGWTAGGISEVSQTPQPEDTHPGDDVDLPQHITPVSPEEKARAKSKFALPEPPPTDLKEAYDFQKKLISIPATSRVEYEAKQMAIQLFGKHVHKIQQGLPITDVRPVTHSSDRVRHTGRTEMRNNKIEKLVEFLAGPVDTTPLNFSTRNPLLIRAFVDAANDDQNLVPAALFCLRKEVAQYALVYYQNVSKISYEDRVGEIRAELMNPTGLSRERVEELSKELAMIEPALSLTPLERESCGPQLIANAASKEVFEAYQHVVEIEKALATQLLGVLKRHKELAINDEKSFFGSYDLPHEHTSVSRRFDSLIEQLSGNLTGPGPVNGYITHPIPAHPSHYREPFGLEIVPGLAL